MITATLLFLLSLFLHVSSLIIAFITIYYIIGLIRFIYDAVDFLGKEALKFGLLLFLVFLAIAIPANFLLFYLIW